MTIVFASAANFDGVAINSCFCARVSRLTRYSSWRARPLVEVRRTASSSIGPRVRVYFAPLPALCAARRAGTSFVMPQ